jgi:hypothetical protein
MKLFNFLNTKKKNIPTHSNEYHFYVENNNLITKIISKYKISIGETNPFKLIEANILIRGMQNKKIFEDGLEKYLQEAIDLNIEDKDAYIKEHIWKDLDAIDAPYFIVDKARIYIPFYSVGLNLIYNDECSKLSSYPYDELKTKPASTCIDCFDLYNYKLFESPFTSLIKIKEDATTCAYYHADFETIFIINNQGRLDLSISLFDKYLKNPNKNDIIKRVHNVVDCFYTNNRNKFLRSLLDNEFISRKAYKKLSKKINIRSLKKFNIVNKGKSPDEVL